MTDMLRTHVADLLEGWTDREGEERDALLRMLGQHLAPVRLTDADHNYTSKITAGPAPWDDAVAHLLADISSGSRTIERGLDIACGFQPRIRGGSDGNTRHALSRIPDLADTITANHPDGSHADLLAEANITIGAWHRAALLLLGAERRWAHIRTVDDEGLPIVATCPYCQQPVRIQPDLADEGDPDRHLPGRSATSYGKRIAEAVCVNPGCVDDDNMRRRWPVDPWLGQLLTWQRDTARQAAS